MMFATAGNLDTYLLLRSYGPGNGTGIARPDISAGALGDQDSLGQLPKAERIKAFKRRRASGTNGRREENRGIMFMGFGEVCKVFGDVVEGLAFLVSAFLGGLQGEARERKWSVRRLVGTLGAW